jgi:hypothetical protein
MAWYKNGVQIATTTTASTGVPTGAVAIGGTTTAFSARDVAMGFHASGMSATDAANLNLALGKLRAMLQML